MDRGSCQKTDAGVQGSRNLGSGPWILARRLMLVFVEVRNIGYGSWFLARRLMLAFNESVTSDLDRGSWPED